MTSDSDDSSNDYLRRQLLAELAELRNVLIERREAEARAAAVLKQQGVVNVWSAVMMMLHILLIIVAVVAVLIIMGAANSIH